MALFGATELELGTTICHIVPQHERGSQTCVTPKLAIRGTLFAKLCHQVSSDVPFTSHWKNWNY